MTAVYFMYKANGGEPLARLLARSSSFTRSIEREREDSFRGTRQDVNQRGEPR